MYGRLAFVTQRRLIIIIIIKIQAIQDKIDDLTRAVERLRHL